MLNLLMSSNNQNKMNVFFIGVYALIGLKD